MIFTISRFPRVIGVRESGNFKIAKSILQCGDDSNGFSAYFHVVASNSDCDSSSSSSSSSESEDEDKPTNFQQMLVRAVSNAETTTYKQKKPQDLSKSLSRDFNQLIESGKRSPQLEKIYQCLLVIPPTSPNCEIIFCIQLFGEQEKISVKRPDS